MSIPADKARFIAEKMERSIDGMDLQELIDPLEDEDPVDVLTGIIQDDPYVVLEFLAERVEESYWDAWRAEGRARREKA